MNADVNIAFIVTSATCVTSFSRNRIHIDRDIYVRYISARSYLQLHWRGKEMRKAMEPPFHLEDPNRDSVFLPRRNMLPIRSILRIGDGCDAMRRTISGQKHAECHSGTINMPTALHIRKYVITLVTRWRGGMSRLRSCPQSCMKASVASLPGEKNQELKWWQ